MLAENGIDVRYNVIKKRTEIDVPWLSGQTENAEAVAMTHIQSLASRHLMPTGLVPAMTDAIADKFSYNPAAEWINERPWDGTDRLPDICNTIKPKAGYLLALRDLLVRKWLMSVTAAAVLPDGFRCRGVLTLQGPQGIGKTSWGRRLINDDRLRDQLIKVDHHLDAGNKDSQLGAISHLIVEVGELDSSFRRDIARLKGFLTSGSDKIRPPYGRVAIETQRRTVFYATVNASDFLVDDTGNNRWWTIACEDIDDHHDIDMQQVYAQCAVMLKEGAKWWLTAEEEAMLERQNSLHRSFSVIRDRLTAVINIEAIDALGAKAMTASEILIAADVINPTNSQAKECARYLREWFGEPRRINGRDKWRVLLLASEEEDIPIKPPKSKFD